jgi:hypothetical protein
MLAGHRYVLPAAAGARHHPASKLEPSDRDGGTGAFVEPRAISGSVRRALFRRNEGYLTASCPLRKASSLAASM